MADDNNEQPKPNLGQNIPQDIQTSPSIQPSVGGTVNLEVKEGITGSTTYTDLETGEIGEAHLIGPVRDNSIPPKENIVIAPSPDKISKN